MIAGLLLLAITKPDIDLAIVRINTSAIIQQIQGMMLRKSICLTMKLLLDLSVRNEC